jgi:hypothetical protein
MLLFSSLILKALYADDLGILFRYSNLKEITANLQSAIDTITSFCNKWGLKINKSKTTYVLADDTIYQKNKAPSAKYKTVFDKIPDPLL